MKHWRIAGLAALAALAACLDAPAPVVEEGIDASAPKAAPTPEQARAERNPLHRAHAEAEEPVACRGCHRIEGQARPLDRAQHRCLSCHEEVRSVLHEGAKDPSAQECLTCHEFLAPEVDPWACRDCHSNELPPVRRNDRRLEKVEQLRDRVESPAVHVEDCEACHQPHGEALESPGVAPLGCVECHAEKSPVRSGLDLHHLSGEGGKLLPEPAACLECHGGHEAAEQARESCLECHEPSRAALVEGHDKCLICHQPHGPRGEKSCVSCHAQAGLPGGVEEHRRCESCHAPHAVDLSSGRPCIACHEEAGKTAASHPPDDERGPCAGCHPQHPPTPEAPLETPAACLDCHEELKPDLHAGSGCQDCHSWHRFGLDEKDRGFCLECHEEVKPIEDHAECADCHEAGGHFPEREPVACGTCHEDTLRGLSEGHSECADCHEAHRGEVEKTCASCHDEDAPASGHAGEAEDCAQCHATHAASPKPEASACAKCHEEPAPLLHTHRGHETCADCHTFHQKGRGDGRAGCSKSGCHEDLDDHEPKAKACGGCHPFESAPQEVWP